MRRRGKPAPIPPPPPPTPPPGSPSPAPSPSPSEPLRARPPSTRPRCAEVAGGTAASCAAVCCCCPCALVDLLVLAVVKLPSGLCRRAIRRRRMARRNHGRRALLAVSECDDASGPAARRADVEADPADAGVAEEMREMEDEMWARFHGGGFWRSPSQRAS